MRGLSGSWRPVADIGAQLQEEWRTDKAMRQRQRFYSLRFLLELAIIPVSLIAAYALFVGVTFGFNLWRAEAPLVTVVWLMIVTSPLWFYLLLKWSQTSATRTAFLAAGVAIPASYFAFQVFA